MKPIGLVTCYFHHNYGSMIQAYATEMIMQQMGLPFQTIACKAPINYMQENKFLYIIKKLLIADWKMRLGKMKIERAKKENPMFAKTGRFVIRHSINLLKRFSMYRLIARIARNLQRWQKTILLFW